MKIATAEFVRSAVGAEGFVRDDRPEIAFVGRSNVGKSSLLNRLLGRKALARTSSTPGRTRAVNYFLINRRFWFVDLPGYGYAKAAKSDRQAWADLVEAYFREARGRVATVLLVDGKVGATPLDAEAVEYLAAHGAAPIVVATKIDRVPRSKRSRALAEVRRRLAETAVGDGDPRSPGDAAGPAHHDPIPVSARTGEGVKELWRELGNRLDAPLYE